MWIWSLVLKWINFEFSGRVTDYITTFKSYLFFDKTLYQKYETPFFEPFNNSFWETKNISITPKAENANFENGRVQQNFQFTSKYGHSNIDTYNETWKNIIKSKTYFFSFYWNQIYYISLTIKQVIRFRSRVVEIFVLCYLKGDSAQFWAKWAQ